MDTGFLVQVVVGFIQEITDLGLACTSSDMEENKLPYDKFTPQVKIVRTLLNCR